VITCDNIRTMVSVAERSKARVVLGRWNAGIVGSNVAGGVAVCPRFTVVLHCAVRDQALG
jgi:hypothetical protein